MRETDGSIPPLDRWSQEVAAATLRGLVRDRRRIAHEEAWRRLQRLSLTQRDWVVAQMQSWDADTERPFERPPVPLTEDWLIVSGDRINHGSDDHDVELWCVPFQGWGIVHYLEAPTWVVPRRYAVIADQLIRASGRTYSVLVPPGEIFDVQLQRPPGRRRRHSI